MYTVTENTPVIPTGEQITTPDLAAEAIKNAGIIPHDREAFVALFLDVRGRMIVPPYLVSLGTVSASLVHPRELFRPAIELSAYSIIVAHNHPSGDPRPSEEDLDLTRRLHKAGDLLGITILDHLVLTEADAFFSIRAEGWLE